MGSFYTTIRNIINIKALEKFICLKYGGVKMKKIITSAILIATTLSLAACSTNKSASSSTNKRDKTTSIVKKKTKKKKTPSTKKKSPKKSNQKNANKTSQQVTNQNNPQQNNTNQQAQNQVSDQSQQTSNTNTSQQPQQQPIQDNQDTQQQASNGISYDENTLTGFVNKYGESPAAYKVEHNRMSQLQALESTPDSMKTFGEKQTQQGMENGSLNPDGNPSNQYSYHK